MSAVSLLGGLRTVLAIGAHPDDIEIGCGASLRLLARVNPAVEVRWLVLTGDEVRSSEARDSAKRYLGDADRLTLHGFRDGYLPYEAPAAVKDALVAHRNAFRPEVVLAPRPDDAHQDHRFLGLLAPQVYRKQLILHYEIAKYDGDLGGVNVYIPVTEDDVAAKIADLLSSFPSQGDKAWFDEATFRGLMRVRGVESESPSGYAEAYWSSKLIVR